MALVMGLMMHTIDSLQGGLQYNVDDYGKVFIQAHNIGLSSPVEFKQFFNQPKQAKSYVYNSNEWFIEAFGLMLLNSVEVREPTFSNVELMSASIGKNIPAGDCTGMRVIATTTTEEGITIVGEQIIGKCYDNTDADYVKWKFQGEPVGGGVQ
jgi:hypothetical protein